MPTRTSDFESVIFFDLYLLIINIFHTKQLRFTINEIKSLQTLECLIVFQIYGQIFPNLFYIFMKILLFFFSKLLSSKITSRFRRYYSRK